MLNVQRTVKQLINVGAKGCFLEDQRWPKRTGHMRNKEVISMEEFAAKVGLGWAGEAGGEVDRCDFACEPSGHEHGGACCKGGDRGQFRTGQAGTVCFRIGNKEVVSMWELI